MRLRQQFLSGDPFTGGSVSRLSDNIFREAAYIAYHFGWSRTDVLGMTHNERRKWLAEISAINSEINKASRKRQEELLNVNRE